MTIEILTTLQDELAYYNNKAYLLSALKKDFVCFLGLVNSYTPPPFVFTKSRLFDFTRSARSRIRDDMTAYLSDNLPPGLQIKDSLKIRAAFDHLFNYYEYKEHFNQVNQQLPQSMEMLIFNHIQKYVAHVYFNSTTLLTLLSITPHVEQYSVMVALTCQLYTYFPIQRTNSITLDTVLEALQTLHLTNMPTPQCNTQAR